MKYLVNSMAFYFLLPIYAATSLLFIFYHIPAEFYGSILSLLSIVTIPVILCMLMKPLRMDLGNLIQKVQTQHQYRVVVFLLCLVVLFLSPLDIYVNGFKLGNPDTYATFYNGGRYIRHITILCWLFVPIAFIFVQNKVIKFGFIIYAILFPIVIIDRNRLFLSFYSLFLCTLFLDSRTKADADKSNIKNHANTWKLVGLILLLFFVFTILGEYRSHGNFIVKSSGTAVLRTYYPLKAIFGSMPTLLQQVILYITTPILNFATVATTHFQNEAFLLGQLSPFNHEAYELFRWTPILISKYNVGTEFFPFLLYGGLPWVVFSFMVMFLSFIGAFRLFKRSPNIFTFFIFIKISYCVLFMGFAPQFYMFLNLMFVLMMLGMWFFAYFLNQSVLKNVTIGATHYAK